MESEHEEPVFASQPSSKPDTKIIEECVRVLREAGAYDTARLVAAGWWPWRGEREERK